MSGPEIRLLKILNLQVTQPDLERKRLEFLAEKTCQNLPEVWKLNNKNIIADGHHRIKNAVNSGKEKIKVNYHCQKNTKIRKEAYLYLTEEIEQRAQSCQQKGIYNISDMCIK